MKLASFIFILFIAVLFSFQSYAQNKFTISGNARDAKTGEDLIGSTVVIKEIPRCGTITNSYGFYSLTIPKGEYSVTCQFIGFEAKSVKVSPRLTISILFGLSRSCSIP